MARVALVFLLLTLSPLIASAVGFGTVRISAPPEISASIDSGTFAELLAKPTAPAASGLFKGLISGRSILVKGVRLIPSSVVASLAVTAAMEYGPQALAFMIDLIWDDSEKKWKKYDRETSFPEGRWFGLGPEPSAEKACLSFAGEGSICPCRAAQTVNPTTVNCRNDCNNNICAQVTLQFQCQQGFSYNVVTSSCEQLALVAASSSDVSSKVTPPITSSVQIAVSEASILKNLPSPGLGGLLSAAEPVSETSGPEEVAPVEKTETTTDLTGQTTKTTTTSFSIDYEGNTVKVTTTEETTTVHPDNTTETVTKTSVNNEPRPAPTDKNDTDIGLCDRYPTISACQPAGSGNDGNDQEDYCAEHPESAACLPVGSLAAESLTSSTQNLGISPELSVTGTCPADISLSILGYQYAMSWQPVCTFASGIRPYVLIGCWLGAVLFVFGIAARAGD